MHRAGWAEFVLRFGCTEHKRALIAGMSRALENLGRAGCSIVYIDGSLAAAKPHPGDCGGRRDETGADPDLLDPVLRNLGDKGRAQKAKYGGGFFPAGRQARPDGEALRRFFQADRGGASKCTGD